MASHEAHELAELSRDQVEGLIDKYIFNETDRQLLKRRLLDGLVYKQLSDEFHLCERQVKNRIYKAQEKLFRHI